jgi:hypothetical protein
MRVRKRIVAVQGDERVLEQFPAEDAAAGAWSFEQPVE